MNEPENPARTLPDWLHLPPANSDGTSFGEQIIALLERLATAFPTGLDLRSAVTEAHGSGDIEQIRKWLEGVGIVSGPFSNCSLAEEGNQAYQAALKDDPDPAAGLSAGGDGPSGKRAMHLVLAVLRQHYWLTAGRKH